MFLFINKQHSLDGALPRIFHTNQGPHCLPSENTHRPPKKEKKKRIRLSKQGLLFISHLSCLSLSPKLCKSDFLDNLLFVFSGTRSSWECEELTSWRLSDTETAVAQQRHSPVWRRTEFLWTGATVAVLPRSCGRACTGIAVSSQLGKSLWCFSHFFSFRVTLCMSFMILST